MLNLFLRILTGLLFIVLTLYWYMARKSTEKNKPKTKRPFSVLRFAWGQVLPLLELLIIIQLLGYKIYPFSSMFLIECIGFIVTAVGLSICIIARKTLADNWTNAYEYQVKKKHELVTAGIYSYIRHPIYLGLTLMIIGGELVAGSWLFISFFAFFIAFYFQGIREEKILLGHFGEKYREYMRHTKMLIPFVL